MFILLRAVDPRKYTRKVCTCYTTSCTLGLHYPNPDLSKYSGSQAMEGGVRKRRKTKSPCQDAKTGTSNPKLTKQDIASTDPPSGSSPSYPSPYFDVQNAISQPNKHGRAFFDVPCATLAKNLLGQYLVRSVGSQRIKGRIVETEAYIGPEDKAAHSYQSKRTPRNEAMFMIAGTSYVYNIYGMYCCINISSNGDGSAVLIRALEPVEGQDLMAEGRKMKTDKTKKPFKEKDLTNGPSKLCQAMHIKKNDFDQIDLTESDSLWVEKGDEVEDESVVSCPRINIGYAGDWKEKPLRFYVMGNSCVSVRDKKTENLLKTENLQGDEKADT